MSVKKCTVQVQTTRYLTCPKHNTILQNPDPENEQEFYDEHGGAPLRTDEVQGDSSEAVLRKRAYELTGHTNLLEAMNFLEAERDGMRKLHDRNTAQAIYIQRLAKLITLCVRITVLVDQQAGLFSPKVHALIIEFNTEQENMIEALKEALRL